MRVAKMWPSLSPGAGLLEDPALPQDETRPTLSWGWDGLSPWARSPNCAKPMSWGLTTNTHSTTAPVGALFPAAGTQSHLLLRLSAA